MPVDRYQIRNLYSLADPQLYNNADNDDPEALLEGVAMAGLVGVLRQLGDLAEFAAEIFHDMHEEVKATAARGHGLLVRVQQLESEISPIEMACLSQTSHSAFFPCSGTNWHPKRPTTQNVITTGGLPQFVMDSYEECRGPPRLFLLDKFDVGGAGACLKRYTDPSIFKVEAPSYDTEISETQGEKNIHQTKKKGSRWKGGEIPEVSQPSHAKLHQLFLEQRVQTGATEAAHRVKLKKRPKKLPFDPESYMNKLLDSPLHAHEAVPIASNGSRLEDSSTTGSASGSPMQYTSPCASSRKVDDNEITADDEIHTYCLQNGYPSEDIESYMDALGTMEPEVETSINQGMYSDSNENQLQPQLSDSQSIENSTASVTRRTTDPFATDSPPRPFACMEIPFRPRVPPVADDIPVTQNSGHDITNDNCIDASKVSDVYHVDGLEEHQSDRKDTAKGTSEHCDVLRVADDLSSFSFVRNHNGDLDNKYPNDSMSHLPNILEMTKNQVVYDEENHSTDSVVSSSLSVISHVNELSSDTTFNNDSPTTEEASEKRMKDGGSVLVVSEISGCSVSEQDSKECGEMDQVDVLVISQDALDNNDTEIPSLNSKILVDHIEEKVDHSESQLHLQLPLHTEGSQLPHGTHIDNIQDLKSSSEKVKLEGLPPLPPLPPMQWRTKKSNGGQLSDNHFLPSTFLGSPKMTDQSTIDETTDIEVFWSSSSPYPLPPIFDEIQNNTKPMRVQRPRNPLIDAVAAHDKIKMRKVSDQDTTQTPVEEERDTLLGQIRAKSFNLKPTVQTRPSIQGPTTNLRVAAILEKANAIRQAFAGSDEDDNGSENWSDS